jgi:hypothetical protein
LSEGREVPEKLFGKERKKTRKDLQFQVEGVP